MAIVTGGEEGIYLPHKQIKGYDVDCVDVTGAGDVVTAVLAYCLARGVDIETACRLANAGAAISVTRLGCYQPTIQETLSFFYERT